jgi:DtxR family Mn-dependent transcriptional regulator
MAVTEPARESRAVEDYVKAVYALTPPDAGRVTTNALAERLGVTPASASGMVKQLVRRGLVDHVRYHGVRLTAEGQHLALQLVRHHRLLELYLVRELGLPLDHAHREAEALEHALSDDIERRIDAQLGHPTRDPHGAPIPDRPPYSPTHS